MREVQRTNYLDWLRSGRDRTDVVKVITGMRGSGKTVLMHQFMQRLIDSGVPEGNIVYMNLESREWQDITNHGLLLAGRRPSTPFRSMRMRISTSRDPMRSFSHPSYPHTYPADMRS